MLWTVCHVWPSGACSVFNCYCHWSSLVLRNRNRTTYFLHSRDAMNQGDPLYMVTYGIWIIPLINWLNADYPDITQPWYTGDGGSLGTYDNIDFYFNFLKSSGLDRGYQSSPPKRVLIANPDNLKTQKTFGLSHRFRVFTGTHYFGGFIRDDNSKHDWLQDGTETW